MIKKWVKLIVLLVLISFFYSCMVQEMINVENKVMRVYSNILGLVKINNDWIEFKEGEPAILNLGMIVGKVKNEKGFFELVSIPVREVKMVWIRKEVLSETILNFLSLLGFPLFLYWLSPLSLIIGSFVLISLL